MADSVTYASQYLTEVLKTILLIIGRILGKSVYVVFLPWYQIHNQTDAA